MIQFDYYKHLSSVVSVLISVTTDMSPRGVEHDQLDHCCMMACFFAVFRFGFKALLAAEAPRLRALLRNRAGRCAFSLHCKTGRKGVVVTVI